MHLLELVVDSCSLLKHHLITLNHEFNKEKLANWANCKFDIMELGDLEFKLEDWANRLFQTCEMSTEGARGS